MTEADHPSSSIPSQERLLDAEEIEQIAKSLKRPTARMQLESLAKKLRKEAAGLKALEAVGTTTTTANNKDNDNDNDGNIETKKQQTATTSPPSPPTKVAVATATATTATATTSNTVPYYSTGQKYITIDRFAFDAGGYNDRFVTLYISLPGVGETVPKDQITCTFTKDSFDLIVRNYHKTNNNNNKSYRLFKDQLEKDIDPSKSKYIVKADKIVIKLQKIKGEYGSYDYWSKLTDPKRNEKKKKKNSSKSNDPTASINDLMKDMYESGDDNMKKMIAETMIKQRNGELNKGSDPLAGMGGMDDDNDGDFGMGGM